MKNSILQKVNLAKKSSISKRVRLEQRLLGRRVTVMKFGVRKPSLKKSISARTTGKLKRRIKKAIDPTYGRKGVGWIKNPKKAAYNKVYNKTSIGLFSLIKKLFK